jgi:hypothetical protein
MSLFLALKIIVVVGATISMILVGIYLKRS